MLPGGYVRDRDCSPERALGGGSGEQDKPSRRPDLGSIFTVSFITATMKMPRMKIPEILQQERGAPEALYGRDAGLASM